MRSIGVGLAGLVVAGCAGLGGAGGGQTVAVADLVSSAGAKVGVATLTESGGKVRIAVEVGGLTPGRHGIHIHAVGRCDPPGFTTAGGHYNPLARKHGLESADGPHAGDLPNLVADAAGKARYAATTEGVTLRKGLLSVFDGDGSAIVIHEKEDDQRTDPTGESGGRVACGVIRPRA
jgi:Cu-Zn family superoxide dismutase